MLEHIEWRLLPGRLLDPVILVFAALAAASLARRSRRRWVRRAAPRITGISLLALYVASTPAFASFLVRAVSAKPRPVAAPREFAAGDETAIVLLSGGLRTDEPSAPSSERLTGPTVQRTLGAARLYREVGAALVIIAGGRGPVGDGMRELLERLGVPSNAVVLERESLDTKQNATNTARLLEQRGIQRALLVTSALHMRRALWEFDRAGAVVEPAPVDFVGVSRQGLTSFLPSASALGETHAAMHEVLGRFKP